MNAQTEITDELAAKEFALTQTEFILRCLTAIKDELDSADCLEKEIADELDDAENGLLIIETRLE